MDTRAKVVEEHLKKFNRKVENLGKTIHEMGNKMETSDQTLKALCNKQDCMEMMMGELNSKHESLAAMMAQMMGEKVESRDKQKIDALVQIYNDEGLLTPHLGFASGSNTNGGKMRGIKHPKIDFPYFSGEGLREWLRKARKYFQIHQIPDELRVSIAEMHLKVKANVWFHGFISSNPNVHWDLFSREVCRRFAEATGEEVIEAFSKIKQRGIVAEYQEQFEDLKFYVMLSLPHLLESYYIFIFTSGLKE
ncbi:uncharacterized protein LOC111376862 [Olea europaea var. sylvestris]|uniref:uncharacterized protein LOC111376862 n=1 Tax=Olea europaea var. sylvestris TaxID=158386 RepID=UPI000C1CFC39|nr:uncharacterized protein LOC111376862 [Olea europaea var. sylvestris]